MYCEMGGLESLKRKDVQVIKVREITDVRDLKIRNPRCLIYNRDKVELMLFKKHIRPTQKKFSSVVKYRRPVCFKTAETVDQ